jgi:hypothetical protein
MDLDFFDEPPPWVKMLAEPPEAEEAFPGAVILPEPEEEEEEPDNRFEATWTIFEGEPGMDNMYDVAKDWLGRDGGMLDTFGIMPVNFEGGTGQ